MMMNDDDDKLYNTSTCTCIVQVQQT